MHRSQILLAIAALSVAGNVARADQIDDLQPGQWLQIANSKISSVFPSPTPPGNSGPASVTDAWSGGTYDSTHNWMIVWGGGHEDYSGNEVYAFDLGTLHWQRVTDPSTDVGGSSGTFAYPDGKPRAMHTHGYIEFVPPLGRFVVFGGVAPYPDIGVGQKVFNLNLDTKVWDSSYPSMPSGGGARGSNAVFDSVTGDVWVQTGEDSARLHRFHTATKTWTSHGSGGYIEIYNTAAIDTNRHRFVTVGGYNGDQILMWDLNSPDTAATDLRSRTTGDKTVETARAPGFQYDTAADKFVGWNGGTSVYTLDPATWAWSRVAPASSNTVTPSAANENGTYGRWRYVPSRNVFVLVNSTDSNVYVYRLSAGAGSNLPTLSLAAQPSSVGMNGTSTLTWTSTLATSCNATGSWSGTRPTSGTENVGPLTANATFTLTCQDSSGNSVSRQATITVASATPAPTITLSANPTSVTSGGSTVLAWTASNATSCMASGAWSGSKATTGSQTIGSLTVASTFTLSCTGSGGNASKSVSVGVAEVTGVPSITLSASPMSVGANGSSALTWSSQNATSCAGSGSWSGTKATSGTEPVGPLSATSTFTLTCTGAGGSAMTTVTVTVAGPVMAPTLDLSADPASVAEGTNTTLTWSSNSANSCMASGGWSGSKDLDGNQSVGPITSAASFTLTCTGDGGSVEHTVTVTVRAANDVAADSGGGSFDVLGLLFLAGGLLARAGRAFLRPIPLAAIGGRFPMILAALLAAASLTAAPKTARAGTDIVTVTVSSESSSAQANVPVTFGQVFKQGQFAAGSMLGARLSDGTVLSAQLDKKATHGDGSLRHGVVTLRIPGLAAGASQTVQLSAEPSGSQGAAVALSQLLATSYDTTVTLNVGGTDYIASARSLLQAGATLQWLSGPQVSEWIVGGPVKTSGGTAHPHLAVYFHVRAYAGIDSVRTDVVVENNWSRRASPSSFSYTYSIKAGGVTAGSGTLTHYSHARWHQPVWWGTTPKVYVGLDNFYLQDTKAIPRYRRVTPTEATLNALRQTAAPMTIGDMRQEFGDTGFHPQIGPMPKWAALFATTGDRRALRATLANGDAGGTYSIHYRDETTGYPLSITEYPQAWSQGDAPGSLPSSSDNPNSHDIAHQPAIAYVPYLVTGDYFYLEELQFWANYNMLWANPDYRGADKGWVGTQIRAMAWAMRTLGEAAYATPDDHHMKAYFVNHIQYNIDHQTSHEQASPNIFGISTTDNYTWDYDMGGGTANAHAPWQDDFFTWTVGHLVELGFTSANWLYDFKSTYPIDRLTNNGFCYVFSAVYTRQFKDASGGALYPDWNTVYLKNHGASLVNLPCGGTAMASALGIDPGEINSYREVTSYIANMYPAAAVAADSGHANGAQAWAVLEGRARKPPEQDWGNEPEWAIIPRTVSNTTPIVNLGASPNSIATGDFHDALVVVTQRYRVHGLGRLEWFESYLRHTVRRTAQHQHDLHAQLHRHFRIREQVRHGHGDERACARRADGQFVCIAYDGDVGRELGAHLVIDECDVVYGKRRLERQQGGVRQRVGRAADHKYQLLAELHGHRRHDVEVSHGHGRIDAAAAADANGIAQH